MSMLKSPTDSLTSKQVSRKDILLHVQCCQGTGAPLLHKEEGEATVTCPGAMGPRPRSITRSTRPRAQITAGPIASPLILPNLAPVPQLQQDPACRSKAKVALLAPTSHQRRMPWEQQGHSKKNDVYLSHLPFLSRLPWSPPSALRRSHETLRHRWLLEAAGTQAPHGKETQPYPLHQFLLPLNSGDLIYRFPSLYYPHRYIIFLIGLFTVKLAFLQRETREGSFTA